MGNSFPWIIGANAFYDFTSSSNDFDYHQWGAGLEWMSPYLDMRVNGYFPQTSENIVDETSETSVSTSSSTTTSTSFGTLFPSGHNVFQNFTTTTTTTTSRTSTTRFFEQYERALKGFDGEAGILVPEHLTWFPIRFYGGFYSFENPYGDDITGPKARIEARPFSFLLLDAAWYQDEELLGSNWFLNARAEITIGGSPRPTTSSKPLHDTTEGPKTEAYNPYASFRSRLVERIPRNYTSVLTISPFLENETLRQVSTSRSSISEVETGQITIASRLIFVDAARGSLTGSGTWQSPANTIQGGADLAISKLGSGGQIWTVWTQGEVGPYAEDVTVTNSVRFTSSSIPITGRGGQRFGGSGNGPVVQGGFLFGTLPAGPASPSIPVGSVQGYEITGGHSGANFAAVTFVNVENATFSQNRIDTIGGNGIEVFNTGSTEASGTFASNGIFNTGGSAIRLNLSGDSISSYSIRDSGFQNLADNAVRVDASDTADFDINVERLSASGLSNAAVFLNATDDSTGSISMRNSSFDGGGADATLAGNAQATLAVTGTRIENDPNSVFLLNADDDAELTTRIQNNILEDNASAFEMEISGSAVSDTLFSGNRIENTTSRAVFARFASSGTHDMTISGNSLSSVDGDGLVLVASNGDVDADVSQNTVDTATGRGIVLRTSASGDMDATASGNILSNVASGGVLARSTGSSDLDADLSDNQVSNSGAYGLRFQADNAAAQIGSSATENTIRDTVDSAVELIANNDALMDVVVSRNIIVDVAAAGIRSVASDDSFVRLVATFNNISNSTDEGISFTAQDDSFTDFQAFNNQIASTGNASGIGLFSSGDSFTQGVINGNQIGPTAQQGIEIEGSDTASGFLSITSNQINDTSQDGIRATLQSTQSQSISVRDNNFQSIGANAINLTTEDNKGATIFDNQIGTTGGFALRVDMQSAGLLLNGSTQGDNQYTDATPAPFLNAGGTPAGDGVRINGVVYP